MGTETHNSHRIILLIEEATKRAGNESKLAGMIDDTRHHVNAWKQGKRVCPIEAQVLMGAVAGRDTVEVLKEAVLEKHEGTAKGEKLMRALGKGLAVAGVVLASALCASDALASKVPTFHDVYFEFLRAVRGHFRSLRFKFC